MRSSHAFTVMSLIISLSLTSFLGFGMCHLFNKITLRMAHSRKHCYHVIHDTLILDVLKRDIEQASFYQEGLNLSDNSFQILTLLSLKKNKNLFQEFHVLWQPSNDGGFHRIKGQFDFVHKKWIKKRTTFFETSFLEIRMQPIEDQGTIKALLVFIKNQGGEIKKTRFNILNQQIVLV